MKPTTLLILRLGGTAHSSRFCFVRDYFLGRLHKREASLRAHKILLQAHPDAVIERTFSVTGKRLIIAVEVS